MSTFNISILALSCFILANCGGGGGGSTAGLASSAAFAKVVNVSGGQVNLDLSDESHGNVQNSVGIAAYGAGVDTSRGQIVTAAGYTETGGVGAAVTSGTVTYDTDYGVQVASNIDRTSTIISADTVYQDESDLTLTANFNTGKLTGSDNIVDFDGTISGRDVSGSVDVAYSTNGYWRNENMTTELDGKIGADGVIGTFIGVEGNTASVSGAFVGVAN